VDAHPEQVPINVGVEKYEPLFRLGLRLGYG
jgi:hypothetical protein